MSRALPWSLAGLGAALVVGGLTVVLRSGAEPVEVLTGGYTRWGRRTSPSTGGCWR